MIDFLTALALLPSEATLRDANVPLPLRPAVWRFVDAVKRGQPLNPGDFVKAPGASLGPLAELAACKPGHPKMSFVKDTVLVHWACKNRKSGEVITMLLFEGSKIAQVSLHEVDGPER